MAAINIRFINAIHISERQTGKQLVLHTLAGERDSETLLYSRYGHRASANEEGSHVRPANSQELCDEGSKNAAGENGDPLSRISQMEAKNKRATPCERDPLSLLQIMARPAGIEPTTPWFVAKYSIQLSYGREERDYNTRKTVCETCTLTSSQQVTAATSLAGTGHGLLHESAAGARGAPPATAGADGAHHPAGGLRHGDAHPARLRAAGPGRAVAQARGPDLAARPRRGPARKSGPADRRWTSATSSRQGQAKSEQKTDVVEHRPERSALWRRQGAEFVKLCNHCSAACGE